MINKDKEVFGIRFQGLPIEESIEYIGERIRTGEKTIYGDLNAQSVLMYQESEQIKKFFDTVDVLNLDGQSVVWAYKLFNKGLVYRTTGCDLMYKLIDYSARNNYKCFFLGAKQEVLEQMMSKVREKYGSAVIGGYRNGYFIEKDEVEIVDQINRSSSQILFIGITSPKKEGFLLRNQEIINSCFNMGVGGSFDVYAGLVTRAPKWMQKCGLEWLYRVIQEPKRMWKRYLIVNSRFVVLLIKEVLKKR